MKKIYTLLSILFLFSFSSRAQLACVASFTASVNNATKTVSFTNTSTGAPFTSYWSFGNGTGSDAMNPTKTFNAAGFYRVCLTIVKTDSSCTSSFCDTIYIAPTSSPCNAIHSRVKDHVIPKKYTFEAALNDTNYYYLYTFGDGTSSNTRLSSHVFAAYTKYNVCLRVTKKDSSCTYQKCDTLKIEAPVCNASWSKTADPSNAKKAYFIPAVNDTNYRYLWTFGDGTSSDGRNTFHTFASNGKYKVCLKITKKDSSCTQTKCDSITVGETPCNANFSKMMSNSLPRTFSFEAATNNSNLIYRYTFGDGTKAVGRFQMQTYATNGTYTVCLTVTNLDSTCSQTTCQTIVIGGTTACNASFNVIKSDSIGSNPHYVRFTNTSTGTYTRCIYTFGDGTSSDNCNPIHYFSTLGSKTVCLTIYKISNSDTLCRSTTCRTFTTGTTAPTPCVAVFEYARVGITGTYRFVNRSSGSNLIYRWEFDGGNTKTSTNAEHTYLTPGLHTACLYVTSSVDTNCYSVFCVSILFPGVIMGNQTCAADFESIADPSNPGNFTFNSFSGNNVNSTWNFGDGSTATGANTSHNYGASGNYYVCLNILNETDSCSAMRCDSVQVNLANSLNQLEGMEVKIYPVPVTEWLTVDLNLQAAGLTNVYVYSLSGQLLVQNNTQTQKGKQSMQLDLSQLPKGVYILQIEKDGKVLNRKIVK